jgi:hypothetical protein
MATKTRVRCNQCDQLEERCECEKYCILCQGQMNVRLCEDSLYYCDACREAAGHEVSS